MSRPATGFLLVRAGDRRVGLDLAHVLAVAQLDSVRAVPSQEPAVRGVTAVYGKMVPVIHLGALIDGLACPPAATDVGVLVTVKGRRFCLEVDDAELLVREGGLQVTQGTAALPWATAVARHDDGLVPLLDLLALSSRFLEAEPI